MSSRAKVGTIIPLKVSHSTVVSTKILLILSLMYLLHWKFLWFQFGRFSPWDLQCLHKTTTYYLWCLMVAFPYPILYGKQWVYQLESQFRWSDAACNDIVVRLPCHGYCNELHLSQATYLRLSLTILSDSFVSINIPLLCHPNSFTARSAVFHSLTDSVCLSHPVILIYFYAERSYKN